MATETKKRPPSAVEDKETLRQSQNEKHDVEIDLPKKKLKHNKKSDEVIDSLTESKDKLNVLEKEAKEKCMRSGEQNVDPLNDTVQKLLKEIHKTQDKDQSLIEFINKRNNYSDPIKEYNLVKTIHEENCRRRSSIIEEDDNVINQWHKLQKMAFELTGDAKIYKPGQDPRDFNVLWRGYVKVLNKACKRSKKHDEKDDEVFEDKEEKNAEENIENVSLQEDPELELFDEMGDKEKIMKLNVFLRSEIYYCCFCGIQYKDEKVLYEHCPGNKQEDHE